MSLLTGTDSRSSARIPDDPMEDPDIMVLHHEQMQEMQAMITKLTQDLAAAKTESGVAQNKAAAAEAEATAARAQLVEAIKKQGVLQSRLEDALVSGSTAQSAAAAARAEADGLRAQVAAERESCASLERSISAERQARADMQASLNQVLLSSARRAGTAQPAEPPAYELVVEGRDANERAKRMVLRPIAKSG